MAKIDFSTIEGYEEMTAEEKLAALEGFEIPEPDYTGYVKKELFDKASSEIAGYKKKEFERMTEEEAAKAKAEEERAAMQARLEELERDKVINEYTAQFLGIGYDKDLAKETAEALQKGDMNTVFLNQTKFATAREKALKAEFKKQALRAFYDAMGYIFRDGFGTDSQTARNVLSGITDLFLGKDQ